MLRPSRPSMLRHACCTSAACMHARYITRMISIGSSNCALRARRSKNLHDASHAGAFRLPCSASISAVLVTVCPHGASLYL